jgi:hypothetical protein
VVGINQKSDRERGQGDPGPLLLGQVLHRPGVRVLRAEERDGVGKNDPNNEFIGDQSLTSHFLMSAEALFVALKKNFTDEDISREVHGFVELFSCLSDPPIKTAQGLWAELFLIERSSDPKKLMTAWHSTPEDKFDFNANKERIEVKSTGKDKRFHHFSLGQLDPPKDTQTIVASLFAKRSAGGKSIEHLILSIQPNLMDDIEMMRKLFLITNKTLGDSISDSLVITFDYEAAKESLAFYEVKNIPRIMNEAIPIEVSDVSFDVDLGMVEKFDRQDNEDQNGLIDAAF